jgi:methylphosphotriester-DNA--protein-cysteine methyltransferase
VEQPTYILVGRDGRPYESPEPGTLGGHRGTKVYGRLDCRAARTAIERGGYVKHRVFFADEQAAIAAGYRPCGVCMHAEFEAWKTARAG